MSENLKGMPLIIDEFKKSGMRFNSYTAQDLQYCLDEFESVATDYKEAVKMVILAIRKAKSDGKYSTLAIRDNQMIWLNHGLKTADEIGEFVKNEKRSPHKYGNALETRPDWDNATPELVSEEEKQDAIRKLNEIRERRKARELAG